jgi:prepilin-type N-terminal cleavage/methylation domain-containing protein
MSRSGKRSQRGFTIIEVLIATTILFIGVSAMALLTAYVFARGRQAKYMNVAATLTSEKLEDLNRYTSAMPQICVQSTDTQEGGLVTSPANGVTSSITCPSGVSQSVTYFDQVSINFDNNGACSSFTEGCFSETVSCTQAGVSGFCTTFHAPNGIVPGPANGTTNNSYLPSFSAAVVQNGVVQQPVGMTYIRSWLIEANPVIGATTITGARRITVLTALLSNNASVTSGSTFGSGAAITGAVAFQMSMVHQ